MNLANEEIREKIKRLGLYQYQVAYEIGISEPQFVRWLRFELPEEKKELVNKAIDNLKAGETK